MTVTNIDRSQTPISTSHFGLALQGNPHMQCQLHSSRGHKSTFQGFDWPSSSNGLRFITVMLMVFGLVWLVPEFLRMVSGMVRFECWRVSLARERFPAVLKVLLAL